MAPEGRFIVLPLLFLVGAAGLAAWALSNPLLRTLTAGLGVLLLFNIYFFRDPVRDAPDDPDAFLSPADGKVVALNKIDYDAQLGGEAWQISIFLALFDVHAQRVPMDATVEAVTRTAGKFRAAFNPIASRENERMETLFSAAGGKFKVVQIAGLVARRILCYMEPAQVVSRGERLGFIRFGSRVDIILPADFKPVTAVGEKVKGGKTTLGHFGRPQTGDGPPGSTKPDEDS